MTPEHRNAEHALTPLPLAGRTAVITGVSRRQGIGFAVASRLARMGASLFLAHYSPHDADQPWGADSIDDVVGGLRDCLADGAQLAHASIDLADAGGAGQLIRDAAAALGHLDILICNHARSGGDGPLEDMTAGKLDAHWRVNARSTILATRDFALQHDGRPGGRVVWMTSGQINGGIMEDEIAYATSKAALAGITPSVAADLVRRGIALNTVNPGPVNTGYLDVDTADRPPEVLAEVLSRFPGGRFGEPDDPARLIAWLVSDEGRWIVGQVLSSDGGFR
ncbi:SDR family oxidoreductase [Arthrobacter gengyunqii]|uniref:SDR family oxidoreductase n=1 Tax=Arthrobacter gengyunqii TaxID=2886940 RepID=A0ABS8GF18_9MICC|nr:SDR family oxidoreductase [Arthrobacter gengyunqii]MCC3265086.1 SDR family oxidoreductase [Arthrobacter gengyunqii]